MQSPVRESHKRESGDRIPERCGKHHDPHENQCKHDTRESLIAILEIVNANNLVKPAMF